jgi:fumarate reductase subunit C
MSRSGDLAVGAALTGRRESGRWPARLDFMQSASGLFLALFLWVHLFAEASILLGKDAMYRVTIFFEGYYFFGDVYPILITLFSAFILTIIVIHAVLAVRKIPVTYRQYRVYRDHQKVMRHEDTTLWWVQVYTGFALFFLASVHIYTMLSQPGNIGPYASADRVVSEWMWPLYALLLVTAVLHAAIGSYRVGVKWGWLPARDPAVGRQRLKWVMRGFIVFYLLLGSASLGTYIKIGVEHREQYGERYVPTWKRDAAPAPVSSQEVLP